MCLLPRRNFSESSFGGFFEVPDGSTGRVRGSEMEPPSGAGSMLKMSWAGREESREGTIGHGPQGGETAA